MRNIMRLFFYFYLFYSTNEVWACGLGPVLSPWSLNHNYYSGDQPGHDELPYLSPGNDTRTNLQIIMMDASPWKIRTLESHLIHRDRMLDYNYDGIKEINLFEPALFTKIDLDEVFCKSDSPKENNKYLKEVDDSYDPYKEGSRCDSSVQGSKEFENAVNKDPNITKKEKNILINQRRNLKFDCQKPGQPIVENYSFISEINNPSKIVLDFSTYIAGAKSFYDGNFDRAISQFSNIANSENKWVAETSQYMIGRVYLNKAQVGAFSDIDGVPIPKVSDNQSIVLSRNAFLNYLRNYPSGSYAKSVNGLMRRLAWLSQDYNNLSKEYIKLIEHVGDIENTQNSADIANEIDSKYLSQEDPPLDNVYFIAIESLRSMRNNEDEKAEYPEKDLIADVKYFQKNKALYLYLLAARAYYVDKKLQKAKTYLSSMEFEKNQGAMLNFSRNMLVGQIYLASKDYQSAEKHFLSIMRLATYPWMKEAVEVGLAISWERLGTINKAFEKETRLDSPRVRAILIKYIAGPIILRDVVNNPLSLPQEKVLAFYVLLFKESTRAQYKNFIDDINIFKSEIATETPEREIKISDFYWSGNNEGYPCPGMLGIMKELDKNPSSSHGLLCLSDFIRINELDDFEEAIPGRDELGGGKSIFPGQKFSRGDIYKRLISDKSTSDTDKSYALFRAIMCYSPTNLNGCGGANVPISQRKKWFDTLKVKYGNTPWAKNLQYYW